MWVASQEHVSYEVTVRRSGKFTNNSLRTLMSACFAWTWDNIVCTIYELCMNNAAVAAIDQNPRNVRLWLDRAEKIKAIQ